MYPGSGDAANYTDFLRRRNSYQITRAKIGSCVPCPRLAGRNHGWGKPITFSSTSDNPTNLGDNPSRTITWTVSDGALSSNSGTSTVNVTGVNDAPVVTATATVGYTEQGGSWVR